MFAMSPVLATVIGDIVGSRRVADRSAVQARLVEVLGQVNRQIPARQPLEVTVGDEFQGAYDRLADALRVSLVVRLSLLPGVDTRYGIGLGGVTVFAPDRAPLSQDGPGWWAAREAIEVVKAREGRRASARATRTWCVDRSAETGPARLERDAAGAPPATAAVNAFLVCRDETVARMGERPQRLLLGVLRGATQSELAEQENVSQSAVSQALARSGAYAVRDGHEALDGRAE